MTKNEMEFLPAALEIVETPSSPLGRKILWSIISFFLIAVTWSMIGEVDIVAVAQGKIIPSGRVKVIQPLETGVITVIHVKEDQLVTKGDVLIELDTTNTSADRDRLLAEQNATQQDKLRLQTLLGLLKEQITNDKEPITNDKSQLTNDRISAEWSEYTSQVMTIQNEIKQRESELTATHERINQLNGTIPLISERASSLKKLLRDKLVARTQWLEVEEERVEQVKERDIQKQVQQSIQSSIDALNEKEKSHKAKSRSQWLLALSETETQLSVYEKEIEKAEQRNVRHQLIAPVTGVIKQLAVHTIGGVVTPAQEMMQIVPNNEALQVEAWLENKDIGFVREGQTAEIKVDAFPFTKYGTIDGKISALSNDAIASEQAGLIYNAQVDMSQTSINVNGQPVKLSPGMSVTVEAITGKRRLIEYLMSPLLRYKDESVRER
ncbi:MAG: HlyD family type I secretion periplasmic adaptor subunit [Gammaproteobacteria bacterium]|nr:MAG: HlyD family type I secretion periplasmic adaptor subunit [Gammaproteobacteria bacterium]